MRGVARQKVGWQGRRPADGDVMYRGVARRLSVLFSLPIGMRTMRDGIREPQVSSVVEGIRMVGAVSVSPGEGVSRRRGVPIVSAWSWSDGRGTVRAGE